MKVIAIDSSGTEAALAAVECRGNQVRVAAKLATVAARQLSRDFMTLFDQLLQDAGWTLDDVAVFGAGLGPGSWTGLRIGLTTVKTLAQVRERPLAGVPTFDAMAQHAWRTQQARSARSDDTPPHLLLTAAPCRPGEVYGQIYECSPDFVGRVQPAWIGSPRQMADALAVEAMARGLDAPPALVGPAATLVGAEFGAGEPPPSILAIAASDLAVEIAITAASLAEAGETADPLRLEPIYLAPSAAERNLLLSRPGGAAS